MKRLKSRLLLRLEGQIAASKSFAASSCLKAQRALVLARHGHMTEAREQLTELHQLAFQHPHPEVGAWLHFAEGLMSYYTDFSVAAHEKIAHAYAIAKSANLTQLQALSAAWLAQIAYVQHRQVDMVAFAQACDAAAAPDDHAARYRLCTVMGLAHLYAGQEPAARGWFARARVHAQADGDDAAISALMYNMAEMRTAQARRDSLLSQFSASAVANSGLLLGADSVSHFDAAVGGSVMPDLTPVLRAQILTVEGDFAQARALFEAHLPQAMAAGLARLGSSLLADLAWCRVNTGQAEQGLRQAQEAELELDPHCDVDDRAITYSRLAQIYAALGDTANADRHAQSAAAEWAEFASQQAAWAEALAAAGLQAR